MRRNAAILKSVPAQACPNSVNELSTLYTHLMFVCETKKLPHPTNPPLAKGREQDWRLGGD